MCPLCLTVAGLVAAVAAVKGAPSPMGEGRGEGLKSVEDQPDHTDPSGYDSPPRNVFSGTAPMRAENQRP